MEIEIVLKEKKKVARAYFKREGGRSRSPYNKGIARTEKDGRKKIKESEYTYDFTFIPEGELSDFINYMRRWAFKQFGHYDDDLINDALMKAYRFANKYDESKASKKSWIIAILRNEILRDMKEKRKLGVLSLDKEYGDAFDSVTLKDKLSNDIIDSPEDDLPENYDKILYLVESVQELSLLNILIKEKLTYIEMSDKYNIPIGTLKSRIFHCRKRLRSMLKTT